MNAADLEELRGICRDIVQQAKKKEAWRATQSDDEFQTEHFCGGYEALEDAFCFSYYSATAREQWFQITLEEAAALASGTSVMPKLRPAE